MAVKSGLGERLLIGEYDLGDVTQQLTGAITVGQLDHTTIDMSAMARGGGKRGGSLAPTVFFDDATGKSMDALKDVPTTDRPASWLLGNTLGSKAISLISDQTSFGPQLAQDGGLVIPVTMEANGTSLEAGTVLTTSLETFTTTGGKTGVDALGAAGSTDFGAQGYLHVTAFTGTSCTVTVEDSDDDGGGDAYASCGLTFTAATGLTSERILTASSTENIKRWLRINLSGTFTSITMAVVVVRNRTARAF